MRVVPSIDVRAGLAVARGGEPRGDPRSVAARAVVQGARELHLVDLDQAERGVPANRAVLAAVARGAGVPCRLAGGISTIEDAVAALGDGFAGVLFSSAAFGDGTLLPRVAGLGDRALVELEVRGGALDPRGGAPDLATRARGRDALQAARAAVAAGVRGLYVVDLGSEGALGGPPLALLERVRSALGADAPRCAFHAGGGVRDVADLVALSRWGAASAVVGRALAEGRFSLADAEAALA